MQIVENAVGPAATSNLSAEMLAVNGHDICRIHVEPSGHPIHVEAVKADHHGNLSSHTAFFIRLANGTREITSDAEIERYIAKRWDRTGT